jgi:hypothetical protein
LYPHSNPHSRLLNLLFPTFGHLLGTSFGLPCFAGFVGHFEVLSEREEVVENLLVLSQLFT